MPQLNLIRFQSGSYVNMDIASIDIFLRYLDHQGYGLISESLVLQQVAVGLGSDCNYAAGALF